MSCQHSYTQYERCPECLGIRLTHLIGALKRIGFSGQGVIPGLDAYEIARETLYHDAIDIAHGKLQHDVDNDILSNLTDEELARFGIGEFGL